MRCVRCPVVVGRDADLDALAALVDRAATGSGSCVIVTGEAGVGKTRLVTEAAARARAGGHPILLGRASPTDRESPLRPLAEALLGALRDVPPPADEALRPYRPAVGRLVPHWADEDRALAAVAPAPLVLAEAVLRTLRWLAVTAAGRRAAVLVIEDLHWADRETLAVLTYLADHAAEVPVAILLTARSDEPSTAAVEAGFDRHVALRLSGLDDAGVAAMAAACLGVPAAPPDVLAATRRAGGLPLAVEDLVELGGPSGPTRYAEIVTRRLGGLDPDGRRLVEAAAVVGNEVEPAVAAAAAGLPDDRLQDARDAAAASRLLVPAGALLGFRHALIREVVLAGLPVDVRRRFARAAAGALDRLPDEPNADSARLGELWAQAGEFRAATEALLRAAGAARSAAATRTAEALLRRALDIAPADLASRAQLELLELLQLAGRVDELSKLGAEALDDLAHDPDMAAAVHLLLGRAAVAAGEPKQAQPHITAVAGTRRSRAPTRRPAADRAGRRGHGREHERPAYGQPGVRGRGGGAGRAGRRSRAELRGAATAGHDVADQRPHARGGHPAPGAGRGGAGRAGAVAASCPERAGHG